MGITLEITFLTHSVLNLNDTFSIMRALMCMFLIILQAKILIQML